MTVKGLRDDVLIKALNMVEPDVTIDGKGVIVISSEEGETEANDNILLKDIQIVDGCILKADDYFQNYELSITIVHKDAERDEADMFEVIADPDLLVPEKPKTESDESTSKSNGSTVAQPMQTDDNDDDSDCVIEDDEVVSVKALSVHPKKRKMSTEGPSEKRLKSNDEDDDLILVD